MRLMLLAILLGRAPGMLVRAAVEAVQAFIEWARGMWGQL